MTLLLLAYVFGAAVTGAWSVGIMGVGRDRFDRLAIVLVILVWPVAWLLAAGKGIADWQEARR